MKKSPNVLFSAELVNVIDSVARDKGINNDDIFNALECGLNKVAQEQYGSKVDTIVSIDRKTGAIKAFRKCLVTEDVKDPYCEISIDKALSKVATVKLGDIYLDELPPLSFNRVSANRVREIINEKVYEAERKHQCDLFNEKIGEIVSGIVRKTDSRDVILEIGKVEAVLSKKESLPRERFRVGDKIRAMISSLRSKGRGPLVTLTRTHPSFLKQLFRQEVPPIYDGIIEIKSIVRDPGSRSKVAVYSNDRSVEPVGACIGPRGARIQTIRNELRGEKIDIVLWSPNAPEFLANALSPCDVVKIITYEDSSKLDVVIPDEQLSAAIGRGGQNINLIRSLLGVKITVRSKSEEAKANKTHENYIITMFKDILKIDDIFARLLQTEGFESIEDIAFVELREFERIEGFDINFAKELQKRAMEYIELKNDKIVDQLKELGVSEEVINIEDFDLKTLLTLAENGVKNMEDFTTFTAVEFVNLVGEDAMNVEEAGEFLNEINKKF